MGSFGEGFLRDVTCSVCGQKRCKHLEAAATMLDNHKKFLDEQKRLLNEGLITRAQYGRNILGPSVSELLYTPYIPLQVSKITPKRHRKEHHEQDSA